MDSCTVVADAKISYAFDESGVHARKTVELTNIVAQFNEADASENNWSASDASRLRRFEQRIANGDNVNYSTYRDLSEQRRNAPAKTAQSKSACLRLAPAGGRANANVAVDYSRGSGTLAETVVDGIAGLIIEGAAERRSVTEVEGGNYLRIEGNIYR